MISEPLVACGSFPVSGGTVAILGAVLVGWLGAAILLLVNFGMIALGRLDWQSKVGHAGLLATYVWVSFALVRLTGKEWPLPTELVLAGVPLVVVGHFMSLLWMRRQLRERVE